LKAAGGRIALDDLTETPSASEGLADMADWARVDVRCEDSVIIGRICDRLPGRNIRLVADHVYEAAQYEVALQLGFDAFAGAFFSRAEPLPTTELPSSTVAALRLLGLARDENVTDRNLEIAISADAVLTFQLLRLVNSAAIGARGVESIGQALRLIGRNAFLRWLSLAIAASRRAQSGVDQHLVRQAVERGRLLEHLGGKGRDPGTLFLVGMFSLLDAVFRMPLSDIVSHVALSDEAKEALLERTGPYADPLAFAEAYELGLFESAAELADTMGIRAEQIPELYTSAISWTAEALGGLATAK
jgi:EAL and modified HD-GYP domain-containing signal transduction protein